MFIQIFESLKTYPHNFWGLTFELYNNLKHGHGLRCNLRDNNPSMLQTSTIMSCGIDFSFYTRNQINSFFLSIFSRK